MSYRGRYVVLTVVLSALIVGAVASGQGGLARQAASPAASTPCPSTTEDENEALVRRYIEETYNQGNMAIIDEVMAPTIVVDPPGPGDTLSRDMYKARIAALRSAFPDLIRTFEAVVTEGDLVVIRTTFTGTHQGQYYVAAATGRRVVWSGLEMVRVTCGQISEVWLEADALGLRTQVGIITDAELASAETPAA